MMNMTTVLQVLPKFMEKKDVKIDVCKIGNVVDINRVNISLDYESCKNDINSDCKEEERERD